MILQFPTIFHAAQFYLPIFQNWEEAVMRALEKLQAGEIRLGKPTTEEQKDD